jgi:hypothetical protein
MSSQIFIAIRYILEYIETITKYLCIAQPAIDRYCKQFLQQRPPDIFQMHKVNYIQNSCVDKQLRRNSASAISCYS